MISAIVLAAGRGSRMGSIKKQFCRINNEFVINYSIKALIKSNVDEIIIVANPNDFDFIRKITKKFETQTTIKLAEGGSTRSLSAQNGFFACNSSQNDYDIVLIHDAARPFVSHCLIKKLISAAQKTGAATLANFATDAIKTAENFEIVETLDRNKIVLIQTPQAFSKKIYAEALKFSKNSLKNFVDDCQLVEQIKTPISIIESNKLNFKITNQFDLKLAEIMASNIDELHTICNQTNQQN